MIDQLLVVIGVTVLVMVTPGPDMVIFWKGNIRLKSDISNSRRFGKVSKSSLLVSNHAMPTTAQLQLVSKVIILIPEQLLPKAKQR